MIGRVHANGRNVDTENKRVAASSDEDKQCYKPEILKRATTDKPGRWSVVHGRRRTNCSSPGSRLSGSSWWQCRRPTTSSGRSLSVVLIQICRQRRSPTSTEAAEAMFSSYLAMLPTGGGFQQTVTTAADADEDDDDDDNVTLSTCTTTCSGSATNQFKLLFYSVNHKKEPRFYFHNKLGKRGPILIILYCCIHAEMNCGSCWNKIYHLASNLLPHYLEKFESSTTQLPPNDLRR